MQEGCKGRVGGEGGGGGEKHAGERDGEGTCCSRAADQLGWAVARYVGEHLSITFPQEKLAKDFKLSITLTSLPTAFHYGAISDGSGPVYTEYDLGGIFACTCTIPSYPDSFGSASASFPTKKAARANAAREAMKYLIDQGLTNPDGTLLSRKKVKLGTAVRVENKKLEVKRDATYAQRVNGKSLLLALMTSAYRSIVYLLRPGPINSLNSAADLCPILGLAAPTYRLSASSASAPNILSGAAYFPGEPRFPDKYGEVRNIFGKKAAKEECARGVWEVLRELAANRGVDVGLEDETDECFT